jgi:hypothetical protein
MQTECDIGHPTVPMLLAVSALVDVIERAGVNVMVENVLPMVAVMRLEIQKCNVRGTQHASLRRVASVMSHAMLAVAEIPDVTAKPYATSATCRSPAT